MLRSTSARISGALAVAKFCLISGCSPLPDHFEFGYFLNRYIIHEALSD